jgi:hypothetical protein
MSGGGGVVTVIQTIHDLAVMIVAAGAGLGGILIGHYIRRDQERQSRDQSRALNDQTVRLPKS